MKIGKLNSKVVKNIVCEFIECLSSPQNAQDDYCGLHTRTLSIVCKSSIKFNKIFNEQVGIEEGYLIVCLCRK